MPLMDWNDEMSVGVKAMDDDHKKLVDILNELNESVVTGEDHKALGVALEQLIQYTRNHLAREEELLARCDYPDSKEHHTGHDRMIGKALLAQANFRMGSTPTLSAEILLFLKDWLTSHILGSDKDYGPYLNAKGIF